jgi:hypothetical protein
MEGRKILVGREEITGYLIRSRRMEGVGGGRDNWILEYKEENGRREDRIGWTGSDHWILE